ncbi:hypothetical protein KCP75_24935 [Salmonella enterica subsp. enterica]|nr:hypothetical protein KCP75_24935 [Salmonella enterica subsp. enterica]
MMTCTHDGGTRFISTASVPAAMQPLFRRQHLCAARIQRGRLLGSGLRKYQATVTSASPMMIRTLMVSPPHCNGQASPARE